MATHRASRAWTRRQFLARSASCLALAGLGPLTKPNLSRAADRPLIAGAIQSGDVSEGSAVIWARADRPARMQVECASAVVMTDGDREFDFTAVVDTTGKLVNASIVKGALIAKPTPKKKATPPKTKTKGRKED